MSVRSAEEAHAAAAGGAHIIDVKEPTRGPLGCANPTIWQEVRRVVPTELSVSVALGELNDWSSESSQFPLAAAWDCISFAKIGLAGSGPEWLSRWQRLRERFDLDSSYRISWVAVIYADWLKAKAPSRDEILAVAIQDSHCRGVLVDTWGKSPRPDVNLADGWAELVKQIQSSGRFVAWAGGLDLAEIARLGEVALKPDIIAVRGSACLDGDRLGLIDTERVARLREAAARI